MLRIADLTLGYGPVALLTGLDLVLSPGELLAVLGPNGAGKTTLLKALVQLGPARCQCARLELDGEDVTRLGRRARARRIAYLPQQSQPVPIGVVDAVMLGRLPHRRWSAGGASADLTLVEELLRALDLDALAERRCTELSGGELQKVLIARALAQTPRLLALDEPVNHLDLANQLEVLELVRGTLRARQLPGLVVLHDLNLALRFADRFLLLDGQGGAYGGPIADLDPDLAGHAYGIELVRGTVAGHALLVAR